MSIKSSISDFFKVEELRDNVVKIAESKFELKKLELIGKLEKLLAKVVMKVLIGVFLFMIFMFLNILIGGVINHYTQSFWIGYASVIGFYSILFLIFHYNKPKISKVIETMISDMIVEEKI